MNQCDLGMIGLGVMGRNFVLNMADHGFRIAGYDIDSQKTDALRDEAHSGTVAPCTSLKEFAGCLARPRVAMLLVPAGPPVDASIRNLLEYFEPGDIIIDGGNSHFTDTMLREKTLGEKGIHFMGVGISGGEAGARTGPCIMGGGAREAWDRVAPIFEAAAARAGDGAPCVAWLGPGAAGHYVKMVHNGIEYGLMQLIAETYDVMKRGVGLSEDEMHAVYAEWAASEAGGFLIEITAEIFLKADPLSDKRLIDVIRDVAKQKGTGQWASQEAMELRVPTPTIDIAVAMRDLSAAEEARAMAAANLKGPLDRMDCNRRTLLTRLRAGYYTAVILTYNEGLALLREASRHYGFGLNLETVARIWRGGCIIRSALLEKIAAALQADPELPLIAFDPFLRQELAHHQSDLRYISCAAGDVGLPVPAFMVTLSYYDAWRSAWLPDNLIQAQRDYFGAHTYERIDRRGVFHTEWQKAA